MKYVKLYLLLILLVPASLNAEIVSKEINYSDGETNMKGYVTYDDSVKGKRPGIIVVH